MDQDVYIQVKAVIKSLAGIDLEHYKDEQMRRRLDSWLVRSGMSTWEDYFAKVRINKDELLKFRNYLTINVTEFFRDTERWKHLHNVVLPGLLREAEKKPDCEYGALVVRLAQSPLLLR